ncbi:MAG: RNA methyltransferase [Methanotrichaceae archaeon]|nr:RNA methyltransferase [Methanotrichaceae archaeon]
MIYAFELSGEHETIPRSEVLALLELFSSDFREIRLLDQCLLVEAQDLEIAPLQRRLAMTHTIMEALAVCDARLDSVACAAEGLKLPLQSYRLRARRIKNAELGGDQVERAVGRVLFSRGFRADLKNPALDLRAVISGEEVVLGKVLARPDRSGFEARRPHLKPFFYPGVLMPRMARALVNLALVREGEWLLDPFAGTGGILMEACLVGVVGVGVEVQLKLIQGARANLEGLDCSLIWGDARRLPFKEDSVVAAVLDIPYGRSALIRAPSKEELLRSSLVELHRVITPGGRMVIVADRPIGDLLRNAEFSLVETHTDRVHRSLTRHIFVCGK